MNWDYNCLVLSQPDMRVFVREVKEAGFQQINFRISNKGALNCRIKNGTVYSERLDAFGPKFDPLEIFVHECHRQKINACIWMEIFEAGYDEFFIRNPQFTPQGRCGKPNLPGVPSYSHPEVREYFLNRMDEYAEYGPGSIFACIKGTHVPSNLPQAQRTPNGDIGYNPPVVQKYREVYGVDILTEQFDLRKFALINGEFIVDFLAEARQRLNEKGINLIAGATASGITPCYDNLILDWRRIVDRNAADALCLGNSKHEASALYTPEGQKQFLKIRQACKRKGIELHAFVFADLGPAKMAGEQAAFAGFMKFLPLQIDYCRQLGADSVLIHDLEMIHKNPHCAKAAWRIAGSWEYGSAPRQDDTITIPLADSRNLSFGGQVPEGNFEKSPLHYWYAASWWLTDEHSATGNFSFDFHAERNPEPWKAENGGNKGLLAEYDSKVLHCEEDSGRTYNGRCSLLIGAKPGAGLASDRTVAWTAHIDIPALSHEEWVISVWTHGERLEGIANAGIRMEVLSADEQITDIIEKSCPLSGSFSWRQLCVPHTFDERARRLRLSLFMTVSDAETSRGMLWFDKFEIRHVRELPEDVLCVVEDSDSCKGEPYAVLKAGPGIDMVSVPFRIRKSRKSALRLRMRSQEPMPVTVVVLEQTSDAYNGVWLKRKGSEPSPSCSQRFDVTGEWDVFCMDLAALAADTTAKVVIRVHDSGELHIDSVEVA